VIYVLCLKGFERVLKGLLCLSIISIKFIDLSTVDRIFIFQVAILFPLKNYELLRGLNVKKALFYRLYIPIRAFKGF